MILLKSIISVIVCRANKLILVLYSVIRAKSFLFAFVFFASLSFVNGQDRCYSIVDSATLNPIPYCNIQLRNNGFVSNHLGQFCVSDIESLNDTIVISNISYTVKKIVLNDRGLDSIIYLRPKSYKMSEVSIRLSDYKFWWKGNQSNNADGFKTLWHACQIGLLVQPPRNQKCMLETVRIKVKNTVDEKIPVRLHIFMIDSVGTPEGELLPENIYASLTKGNLGYIEFNVLPYQIKTPQSGVFVTVELLSNRKAVLVNNNNLQTDKYIVDNKIATTKARYRHRKLLKVSSWKPGSFYVESYPFTNIPGYYGILPLMKVKLRRVE